jgi:hypothetical protein
MVLKSGFLLLAWASNCFELVSILARFLKTVLREGQKRKSWGPGPTLQRMAWPWAQPGGTPKIAFGI